jgi:hypothetical protein
MAGGIIGSALFLCIYKNSLNIVIEHNRELQNERKELMEKMDSFTKTRNRMTVINDVEVIISTGDAGNLDKITVGEIRKRVESDLQVVVGQKISSFSENPLVYEKLIAQRIYQNIGEKSYVVNVRSLVLAQTELKVWITVKEWRNLPTG